MKKTVNKAKLPKSSKKRKQLKTSTTTPATKKVSSKKQVKNPTQKSKQSLDSIKHIETASIKQIKAENQRLHKELEIEAALERVRSRSMAMHKSIELVEVVHLLNDQIDGLGIKVDNTSIITDFSEPEKGLNNWFAVRGRNYLEKFHVPLNDSQSISRRFMDARSKGLDYYTEKYNKVEKNKYLKWLYKYSDFKIIPKERQQFTLNTPGWIRTVCVSKNSVLILQRYWLVEFSEEENNIFKRFGKVFDQSYTRFLDLQKAEAQAKEAQIEASLERVRSRSMAMQKSTELTEVVHMLNDEIAGLGIRVDNTSILTDFSEPEKGLNNWLAVRGRNYLEKFHVPFDNSNQVSRRSRDARSKGLDYYTEKYNKVEKNRYFRWLFKYSDYKKIPEDRQQFTLNAPGWSRASSVSKNSALVFQRFWLEEFTEEENSIFKRFGKVFEQTYTRFLDLQKAEAQAREAQIEAALEKVRSSSLAMHRSDELQRVVNTVIERLNELNIRPDAANILIFNRQDKSIEYWTGSNSIGAIMTGWTVPYADFDYFKNIHAARDAEQELFAATYPKAEKNEMFNHLFTNSGFDELSAERKKFILEGQRATFLVALVKDIGIQIVSYSRESFLPQEIEILKRFARVFNQAYTRFLDLQKAEAQTREAQIELGLERVRARAMAMQKSDELKELIGTVFIELTKLDLVLTRCLIMIYDPISNDSTWWMANSEAPTDPIGLWVPNHDQPPYKEYLKALQERKIKWQYTLEGKVKKDWDDFLFVESELSKLPDFVIAGMKAPERVYLNASFNSFGNLNLATLEPLSNEHFDILLRFAKVFDLTYTRFNDLQKAEAQTREAQIEVALERIRARTMAMHKSDELSDAAILLYQQLGTLEVLQYFSCGYIIIDEEKKLQYGWMTNFEGSFLNRFTLPLTGEVVFDERYESWKKKDPVFHQSVTGENLQRHLAFAMPHVDNKEVEVIIKTQFPDPTIFYCFNFSSGYLHLISDTLINKDQEYLLTRFTNVFEMTYKRFLDLKKAEEQMREAQIESSLEKVRSKTMAMHNSQDVGYTVATMFEQLVQLGITTNRCGILIFSNTTDTEVWTAKFNPNGEASLIIGHLDIMIHPVLQAVHHAWKNKESIFSYELAGEDIKDYYKSINNYPDYPTRFNLDSLPTKEIHSDFFFPEGYVFAFTKEPLLEEAALIFKRFANVFGQTYRRYLDLQKAETQARQAQIEVAMEKVRARALAMQKPDELIEVAQLLRKEMGLLGVEELETSSIYIHNNETGKTECWYSIKDESKSVSDHMTIDLKDTWVGRQMLQFYRSDEKQVSIVMKGAERKEWINYCADHSKDLTGFYGDIIPDRTYHLYKFSNGYIGAASPGEISKESRELLQRATAVFSLAYTRFSDLQQAEAQTREAIKRASVDRVRAEIASMRTTADLEKITPLVWNELTTLGVPFIRCGVFIMDEAQQQIHTFLSTPDGKAIAAFNTPFSNPGALTEALPYWRKKEIYKTHWDEAQFLEQARNLIQQGAISSPEKYLTEHRPTSLYLHFLPFLQGMLYVGSETSLTEDELQLVQNLANAFSTAYARYEDFNRLEEAKSKIETTLSDLKSTQSQLVQAEKMASLGELTAGIAHEIQNPLNFVNNFASINAELIDEMKIEMDKGNNDEVKALANDIFENELKIMHHGKRAESIVKGMLQHSRTSTGTKESTDINALADEYMRLSYHGLRAKDKSFNADMKMYLDPTLPLVNVIPQDFGRVLLNLFNNAFWAVNQRRNGEMEKWRTERADSVSGLPSSGLPFSPSVNLTTKNLTDRIEIRIADNGPGIPPHIIDKIFQPFFTTKPTGQGTGLGLSLAYDIVKAHGGELKVETKESDGSEFIIKLPIA